ncbi:MAG: MFS transporter [Firmicutes bacterium]|nr:MFS transporter [Bacillota bacterium]
MLQIKKRDLIFAVLCILFIFALFLRACTAVIIDDLMKAFSVPVASLGLMASAFFYAYAAAQIPIGLLSDRIGVRYTVFCFGLLGFAGSAFFAYSTNINTATLARLITGAGTAGIWIPTLTFLSRAYPAEKFASLTSIINATGALGLVLAALPMTLLVEKIGWRHSCFLPGAMMLLLVAIAWFLLKDPALDINQEETAEKHPQKTVVFYRHLSFWLFAVSNLIIYGALLSFISLWGAAYLQDSFGIGRETAGGHLSFASMGMIVGGLFWGTLSDRLFRARRPVIFLGTLGALLTWIAILFLSDYPGPFYTSLLYFAAGTFSTVFLINLSSIKELFPMSIAGTAMGAANALMLAGVAVYQGISGYLLGSALETKTALASYRSIFIFYAISVALAFLFVFFMPETFPGKQKAARHGSVL